MREEVFGPVLALERVASTTEAFARVNASRFGLQAGVFTHDIGTAFLAHRELVVRQEALEPAEDLSESF